LQVYIAIEFLVFVLDNPKVSITDLSMQQGLIYWSNMKSFVNYLHEMDEEGAKEMAKYSEMPPNKIKNFSDVAMEIFRQVFTKYPEESLDFLKEYSERENSVVLDNLKYQMDLTNKNPKQDGLGYAIPNN